MSLSESILGHFTPLGIQHGSREKKERLSKSDREFNRQFAIKKLINVCSINDPDGGISEECVDAVHVVPPNPIAPPVFVEPGYLSSGDDYKHAIRMLYKARHAVVSVDHKSRRGTLELTPAQEQLVETYFDPKREIPIRKAVVILKVLEHEGIKEVNMIAHSAGAVDAALAALIQPDHIKIRNIIFFCPAGLVDKETRLLSGLKDHALASDMEWLEKAGNHLVNSITEGLGLVGINIHALVQQLHKRGVGMFVLAGDGDTIFPAKRIKSFLEDNDLMNLVKFVEFRGGHGDMDINLRQINQILRNIEHEKLSQRTIFT